MFLRKKLRHPAYTDDDPRIVLALRAFTEPRPRLWNFFLQGCAVEFLLLSLAILSDAGLTARESRPQKPARTTKTTVLYMPRARPQVPPPPQSSPPRTGRRVPRVLEDPALPAAKVKLDMRAIEISVEDDTSELPAVVRQQNGMLALLEVDDPRFARYTFAPPDWHMQEGVVDVSRKIRFSMSPVSQWPLVESLVVGSGIKMERYQMNALFDSDFARCLEQEIRNHAGISTGSGRVHVVRLAFNSSRSCGIDVLNVEFYPVQ